MKSKRAYKKTKKRVGRGNGSGLGKTSGRGHKGQGSRAGGGKGPGFEGGQMTFIRRLPKRGFSNARFSKEIVEINLSELVKLGQKDITAELLYANKVIKRANAKYKILGKGKVDTAINVKAYAFSASAKSKIEASGGQATLIEIEQK